MFTGQKSKMRNALALFKKGDFSEAGKEFSEILKDSPKDKKGLLYAGYIALLENRLKDAQELLQKALMLMSDSKAVKSLLTDALYRQDDFKGAALIMNTVNRKAQAAKLDHLQSKKVYDTYSTANKTELEFIRKDPLPLIKVSINGAPPVNFLIDTGAGELYIDTEYAKSLGLKEFGTEKEMFAGDKKGTIIRSCIDSIQLGGFQIENVPVDLMDIRRFSSSLYGDDFRVDGILGTCIFYHFLTTLDYSNDKIIFEMVGKDSTGVPEDGLKSGEYCHMPFWMASDHFMFAKGTVNHGNEMLFFIDTGLGGNSFTCPRSTIRKCGLALRKDLKGFGSGGGGKMPLIPFDIENLSLGGMQKKELHGLFGAFPPSIEHIFGFTVNGLISHEFFREHTVIFDFSKMMLHIK